MAQKDNKFYAMVMILATIMSTFSLTASGQTTPVQKAPALEDLEDLTCQDVFKGASNSLKEPIVCDDKVAVEWANYYGATGIFGQISYKGDGIFCSNSDGLTKRFMITQDLERLNSMVIYHGTTTEGLTVLKDKFLTLQVNAFISYITPDCGPYLGF
jgi:hypothetical protein